LCLLGLVSSALLASTSALAAEPVRHLQAPPPVAESGISPSPPASPRDLPVGHFSYDAIRTLTRHGYLEGFPSDTDPFQSRTVTRYEMASLTARVMRFIQVSRQQRSPGGATVLSQENRALVQRLVAEFRLELAVMGVDLNWDARVTPEAAGPSDSGTKPNGSAAPPQSLARLMIDPERSGDEASRLLSRLQGRVSGYLQFRHDALIGSSELFRGAGAEGSGQRPSLGGPAVGGPSSGFLVRRGRLRIGDQLSPRDEYVFQLDLPTNGDVNVRDAYVRLLDFPARDFAFRAGQFAFTYGFEYLYSSRARETPERALGYSDSTQAGLIFKQSVASVGGTVTPGSVLPFFFNQDRDIGVDIAWGAPRAQGMVPRAAVAIIQGEGRGSGGQRSLNNVYDVVASLELLDQTAPDLLGVGLSYYRGALPVRSAAPTGSVPAPFTNARRVFGGAYVRYQTGGREYRAEYSGGLFEVTPDRALYLKDNRFSAWYVVTRQPITRRLEGYLKYDEYNPARRNTVIAGVKGSDLSRKTLSLGLLYEYTESTRIRLNYSQGLSPYDPSRPGNDPLRGQVGLLQTEFQILY
jgi:hypothetical protein